MAETQFAGRGGKKLTAQVRFDGGVNIETLTGAKTLTNKSANFHAFDGGLADRVVTLPTGTAEFAGTVFWFANVGTTNKVTIKNAAAATILDLVVGASGAVGMDGNGVWKLMQTAIASPTDFGAGGLKTDLVTESTGGSGITVVGAATGASSFGEKITGTINHATNAYRALWAKASAITAARTGGIVSAVMGELVGFATDTSGAKYAAFNGLAPTANGGSALYIWGYVAAGYAYLLDLTAVATNEAIIAIKANLAVALAIKEGANSYLTVVTTNGAEKVVIGQRLSIAGGMTRTPGASTAAAGTTTADAGVLPAGTSSVYPTTAADDTRGVRIHATDQVTGNSFFIGNGVSNKILKVYAPSGGTINGGAGDAAFSTASGKGCWVHCLDGAGNTWLAA